ncbi:hypothetical protein EVA_20603 [gut metagenome]|uniref:Uncharacterized protein n=1 Tax=gut metagenome TaxID=749906 RepID=J9BUP2_9ZZZZ
MLFSFRMSLTFETLEWKSSQVFGSYCTNWLCCTSWVRIR